MSMSTTDPAPTAPGDRRSASSAELCRLTVLSAHTQVDLAVPLRIPLALVIPGIVDTIRSHSDSNDFETVSEQFDPTDWTLAKVGCAPLSDMLSLHEHGIRDGELLILAASDAAAPPPLFDDIMYTVAATDAQTYRRWTPMSARITGSVVAVLASLLASAALIVGATGITGATCAFIASLLLTIASIVMARVYHDSGSALVLGCAAVPLAFTAGLLAVPGDIDAPHLLMGSVLVASVALLCLRLSGIGFTTFTALFGMSLAATAATAAATLLPRVSPETISAVAIALALITLAYSARLSMILARLPLPPVPVPANPLDEARDLVAEPTMPNFDELSRRTGRARRYLTGVVVATSVTAMTGALNVAAVHTDGGIVWSGIALAGVTASVLMLRGRTFAGTAQAVPLIACGAAIVLVVPGAQIWLHKDGTLVIFALALAVLILALMLGILAPNRVFSPVMRRVAELVDLGAIALIVPLICWVTDLFSVMRGL